MRYLLLFSGLLAGCGAAPVVEPEVHTWVCVPKDSPAETGVQTRLKGTQLSDLEFLFETVDGATLYFKSTCVLVPQ